MKVAIIALPISKEQTVTPPLLLGYVASLLEQQRHIVRIYDLAIYGQNALNKTAEQIQAFRPHCIVLANETSEQASIVQQAFPAFKGSWVILNHTLRIPQLTQTLEPVRSLHDTALINDDQRVILCALESLCDDLDLLPFPARHLMEIERYNLQTKGAHFQTNVLIGHQFRSTPFLRNPRLIVSELRNITHEYGVWHVRFDGLALSSNAIWLHDFLYDLAIARLDMKWEGLAHYQTLTPELISLMRRAGCEAITLEFDAMHVLDSYEERTKLLSIVSALREQEIFVHGHILLEPRYSSIPVVVDMSATFGLDDVDFSIQDNADINHSAGSPSPAQLITMAQAQYRSMRDKQTYVERYGSIFGPLIWRIGRLDLRSRVWQRQVTGHSQ